MSNFNVNFASSFMKNVKYATLQRSIFGYLLNRFRWHYYPALNVVSSFPDHVDIETCSTCQMRCPMCFQSVRDDLSTGSMSLTLFKKIMAEIAYENPYSIRLSWRGECLLNHHFNEMLIHARSVYKGNISFLTNALLLDNDLMNTLIDTQTDYIVISADGVGQTYESVRKPAKYQDLIDKLTLLKSLKSKTKSVYPLIRINAVSIWFNDAEKSDFINTFSPLSDRILLGNTVNNFKNINHHHNPSKTCYSPWQRLLISSSGTVHPCCDDFASLYPMGNVNDVSLRNIWHGSKATAIRKAMLKRQRLTLRLCREMDCGVDEYDNDSNPEFISLIRAQVISKFGNNSHLLRYLSMSKPQPFIDNKDIKHE